MYKCTYICRVISCVCWSYVTGFLVLVTPKQNPKWSLRKNIFSPVSTQAFLRRLHCPAKSKLCPCDKLLSLFFLSGLYWFRINHVFKQWASNCISSLAQMRLQSSFIKWEDKSKEFNNFLWTQRSKRCPWPWGGLPPVGPHNWRPCWDPLSPEAGVTAGEWNGCIAFQMPLEVKLVYLFLI